MANLVYGFSKKSDGNMSVKWQTTEGEAEVNRAEWLRRFEILPTNLVVGSLNLGVNFAVVDARNTGQMIEDVDALITRERDVPLFMVVGDCFPVTVFDPMGCLALVHLGYHGIAGKLLPKVVEQLRLMGSQIENLEMNIGPGVKKESYVFPAEEVRQRSLDGWGEFLDMHGDGKIGIDLAGYLVKQAKDLGIKKIDISPVDTIRDLNYFSHYRSKRITGEPEGRIAAVAMMV